MTIVTTNPSHTSMLLQCSSPIPLTYKSIRLFRGAPRGLSAVANVQPTIADTQTGQTWETICESWWWLVLYSASALVSGHSLVMALLPLLSVFVELPMNSMQTCNSVTFYFIKKKQKKTHFQKLAGSTFYQIWLGRLPPQSYLVKCTSGQYQKLSSLAKSKVMEWQVSCTSFVIVLKVEKVHLNVQTGAGSVQLDTFVVNGEWMWDAVAFELQMNHLNAGNCKGGFAKVFQW